MRVKGMRSLATLQTVRNNARPSSRAEMAAQLARLEHERFRGERELHVFEEKKAHALEALQQTQARIDQLKRALYDSEENQGEMTRIPAGQSEQDDEKSKTDSKKVRTVTLGY
jgi:hypothetical protein